MHPFVPPPAPSPDGLPPMDTRPHFMRPTVASSRCATVPPAQEFRYRGIYSSDDSPHADARRQRAIIQSPPSSSLPLAQPARSPDLLPASSPPDLLPIASPEPVPAAFPTPILPVIHPSDLMSGSLERPSLTESDNTTQFHQLDRQFVADYRVRCEAIARWLQFLRLRHPGYRDLQISAAALNALPHDDHVDHLLQSQDIDVDMPPEDLHTVVTESMDDNEPERVVVPDLFDEQEEITAETPLDEFNTRQPLLSLAFPILFPYGEAEFLQQRERKVEYSDYIRHLIKHELGTFAQHPRFRYDRVERIPE
ncbi:hypothetical protein N7492_001363 [Penicillium capsulatum]|uniref:DUF6570 domain-containing protein n=1 Tax=Penicillium capsulatum TaxID=69766 RepID=A0A9W9ITM9_9EURO|nr:hypothetical protein N7492_001363 [Penicillium capsulatum]